MRAIVRSTVLGFWHGFSKLRALVFQHGYKLCSDGLRHETKLCSNGLLIPNDSALSSVNDGQPCLSHQHYIMPETYRQHFKRAFWVPLIHEAIPTTKAQHDSKDDRRQWSLIWVHMWPLPIQSVDHNRSRQGLSYPKEHRHWCISCSKERPETITSAKARLRFDWK